MTNSIDVTINNKVFEVSIVIKDDKGQRVRLPKDFFKNTDPKDFVNLSQNLLKTLEKRNQITWVDGKGVVYKKNPDAPEELSDKQKVEWDKVEDYVLKRFFSLPPEAFNDEDAEDIATELDATQPDATGTSPTRTAPQSSAPVISGRPQVGLDVEEDGIVSTPVQTPPSGAPNPTTQATRPAKRTEQDTGANDQAEPIVTVPQIPAPVNPYAGMTEAERLEAQANAALESLNQQVAALNLSQTTSATQTPSANATQTPVIVSPTPAATNTPTVYAPTHSASAPTGAPAQHYTRPIAPTIQTPSYPETVHEVVDTFFDWVLRKLRT